MPSTHLFHRASLYLVVCSLSFARLAAAQATPRPSAKTSDRTPLDTAAVLASARPEIDAANSDWLPGLRAHDAKAIAAAYADSGMFIAGDGTVTRGRAAVARMYAARFTRMTAVRDGAVVQQGMTVLGPTRILEWGHGWLELAPAHSGERPMRSDGTYVTLWERQGDSHWRIVRNLAF